MTPVAPNAHHRRRVRVLIAGGGVAGLETLLALRVLAGRRVAVTLLAPEAQFVVRATTVGEPFDRAQGRRLDLAEVAAEHEADLVAGSLRSVDVAAHVAVTDAGARLPFDMLVVAAGAVPTAPLDGAVTFRGPADAGDMRAVLDDLVARRIRSVAFAVPRSVSWSLPLYELALMTSADLIGREVRDAELTVVTPEREPLGVFGPAGAHAMRAVFAQRAIGLRTGAAPQRVERAGLALADGSVVSADRVVTVPVLAGPGISGLPADAHGFVPVDHHGRVRDLEDVYAAGDVTAFAVKQGGLAAQQADAVAEAIAARAGAPVDPAPFRPVIRGLLLTGAEPIYLRAELRADGTAGVAAASAVLPPASASSDRPLWWPPAKVAGRYLAPYLATARPSRLEATALTDRPAPRGPAHPSERREALQLALSLADADAAWGDHASALRALEAAESLEGVLPPEYERKREAWRAALAE